jgi:hypothetical protein
METSPSLNFRPNSNRFQALQTKKKKRINPNRRQSMSRSAEIDRVPEQMPQPCLPHRLVRLAAGSNPVKVGQTDLSGQAGSQNQCKSIAMNSLQNKSRSVSQSRINLVNHGQNKPIASVRTSLLCVCCWRNNHEMNLHLHSFDHSGLLEASKIKVNQA